MFIFAALKVKKKMTSPLFNNKLFQTLGYLEPPEVKRLLRYLKSPYFNQSKTLVRLCELLLAYVEKGKTGFIREEIWRKLVPGTAYDDVNFRKYCSDLLALVEGFFAQEAIRQDPGHLDVATMRFVAERKILPLYNSSTQSAKNALAGQTIQSTQVVQKAIAVEQQYYLLMDYDFKLNTKSNIESTSKYLDVYYFSEKLKLYCAAISQRKTSNIEYQLDFMEDIVRMLDGFPMEDFPELAIYYCTYLALKGADEDNYFKWRGLLERYGRQMPRLEAIQVFDSALHYCTGKINQGSKDFLQEYFDLFQSALDQKIFLYRNEFPSWRYNNANVTALRLNKLDWAESFVQQYKDFLPEGERQNTYTFNLARVYLYKKQYSKVLDVLHNVEYEDIGFNLISKTMLVITYYELDELEALWSHMDAFRVFLNRQKDLAEARKSLYLNLLKYLRRLMRLKSNDKVELQRLREDIVAEKARTANHEWLLEKLDELGR